MAPAAQISKGSVIFVLSSVYFCQFNGIVRIHPLVNLVWTILRIFGQLHEFRWFNSEIWIYDDLKIFRSADKLESSVNFGWPWLQSISWKNQYSSKMCIPCWHAKAWSLDAFPKLWMFVSHRYTRSARTQRTTESLANRIVSGLGACGLYACMGCLCTPHICKRAALTFIIVVCIRLTHTTIWMKTVRDFLFVNMNLNAKRMSYDKKIQLSMYAYN